MLLSGCELSFTSSIQLPSTFTSQHLPSDQFPPASEFFGYYRQSAPKFTQVNLEQIGASTAALRTLADLEKSPRPFQMEAMQNKLQDVSTYYLMLELLDGGETGLLPELEPISEESIVKELERRSGSSFKNDKSKWVAWFLGNKDHATELERANLLIFVRTQQSMARVLQNKRPT